MVVNDGDILECVIAHDNGTAGEQLNRFQFMHGSLAPIAAEDVLDDIADLFQLLYNLVKTVISVRNVFREVKVHNITQDKLLGSTDAGTYVGGTGNDPSLPRGNSLYFHFVTDVPRVILSKYLPSPPENATGASGLLTTTAQTTVTALGTALLDEIPMGESGYKYGYLSPKTMAFEVPQVLVVRDVVAYQRRRKAGVGS